MNKNLTSLIIGLGFCLAGCSESFPSVIDPDAPSQSGEVVPQEGQAALSPIMPSLNAPQFSFVTRGTGPFEAWDFEDPGAETNRHWLEADFHTFAYQTTNTYGGNVDMTVTTDHQDDGGDGRAGASTTDGLCLLYDRVMHVADPQRGTVRFVETGGKERTYYYRINEQDKKYNFFTFYADDAVEYTPDNKVRVQATKEELTCQVTIDGTQDIMHSFAYHKRQEYTDRVNDLKDNRYVSADQLNVLTAPDSYNQILYSTWSGHRSINPIFRIQHLLSKFNVRVKGMNNSLGAGATAEERNQGDYHNILITHVSFDSPYTGKLYIAKNAWSRPVADGVDAGEAYEQEVAAGKLIDWDVDNMRPLHATVLNSRGGVPDETYQTFPYGRDPDNDIFHVNSSDPVDLTAPILLPPMDHFTLHLAGYYLNYTTDLQGKQVINSRTPVMDYSIDADIRLSATPNRFEPGKEYTINVYVYGYQHINVEALWGKPWIKGGDINVGEDADDSQGGLVVGS